MNMAYEIHAFNGNECKIVVKKLPRKSGSANQKDSTDTNGNV